MIDASNNAFVQAALDNQSHTFGADYDGTITNFNGGGATLTVFEGNERLMYYPAKSNTDFPSGSFSASFEAIDITPGDWTQYIDGSINAFKYDDLDTSGDGAGPSRYALPSEFFRNDGNYSTGITTDFSDAKVLSINKTDHDGTNRSAFYSRIEIGDRFIYYISDTRWYQYEIVQIDASHPTDRYNFGITFLTENIAGGETPVPGSSGTDVYFIFQKHGRAATLSKPTAIAAPSASIIYTISGSRLGGSPFNQVVTQSFSTAYAGAPATTVVLSKESTTVPFDTGGTGTYSTTGNEVRAYIGGQQLNYGTGNNEFSVGTLVDTNIESGSVSTTTNVFSVGVASNMTSDTATIVFPVTVKDKNGNSTTYNRTQSFAKATQGTTGIQGATGPNFDFITSSLANIDTTSTIAKGLFLLDEVFGFHEEISYG